MRALVVLNPSSKDFEAERRFDRLRPILESLGEIVVLETVPDDKETEALVAKAVEDQTLERIVSIGGDGTLHIVLNALASTRGSEAFPSLAIIPFGTANDVAKSLGLPLKDYDGLARIAMGERTRPMDVGVVRVDRDGTEERRVFVDAVTIGMDADILAARRGFRNLKGYFSYLPAIAERAVEQQSIDVRLWIDGQSYDARVFNVVLNNVPVYCGELNMPDAELDDGLLDVYLFNRREYASKLMTFAIKQLDVLELGVGELLDDITDNQRTAHGKRVRVRMASPRRIQVDGEVFGTAQEVEAEVFRQIDVAF